MTEVVVPFDDSRDLMIYRFCQTDGPVELTGYAGTLEDRF